MTNVNKKLEEDVLRGVARDILLYYENYFIYETIAKKHKKISNLNSVNFFTLVQHNALNAMYLHCCRMYEPINKYYRKRTFSEIIKFINNNKNKIKIYSANACKKVINGKYDLKKDFQIESCYPASNESLTAEFCRAIQKKLPDKQTYNQSHEIFEKVWKVRSKEIAHNDYDKVKTRAKFKDLNFMVENAVDIVNAISHIYLGVNNLNKQMDFSLKADGKSASKALIKVLEKL